MNAMPMMFSATSALLTAAMMVAMMLPSLAAALWRYHRDLRTMRMTRIGKRTALFAAAYLGVWTAVSLLLLAMSARWSSSLALEAPVIVLSAGAVQLSRWKARQLARCRQVCVPTLASSTVISAWYHGCRFGVDCALSCAAPMAILLIAGLMNVPMMIMITAVITAERVMPAGARIARLTGAIALAAGTIMCLRAVRPASLHLEGLRDAGHLPCTIHHGQRHCLGGIVPERD